MADYPYSIRRSKRAKRVSIKISERNGVVITVPEGKKRLNLEKILAKNEPWIQGQLLAMPAAAIAKTIELPSEIILRSIDVKFDVIYRRTTAKNVTAKDNEQGQLIVYGNTTDEAMCIKALNTWLQIYAKRVLPTKLTAYAESTNFEYKKCNVRGQSQRWGSCSSSGVITLNRKLLFLPTDLLEYIFLHELCHTVEMNHSKSFWQLVKNQDAEYKAKDKNVSKHAWGHNVPRWTD